SLEPDQLFPPTAKRLVQLHQRRQYIPVGLRVLLLGGEPLTLGVEHFQIAAHSANVSHVSDAGLIDQRVGKKSEAGCLFLGLLVAHERIGNVLERAIDRLLIIDEKLLTLGLGSLVVSPSTPCVEDRKIQQAAGRISKAAPLDDAKQIGCLSPSGCSES